VVSKCRANDTLIHRIGKPILSKPDDHANYASIWNYSGYGRQRKLVYVHIPSHAIAVKMPIV
jgi:hypothetical protein